MNSNNPNMGNKRGRSQSVEAEEPPSKKRGALGQMDFNRGKKRGRSQRVEAEEPPNKKLCASGRTPKRLGMIISSRPDPYAVLGDRHPLTSEFSYEEAEMNAAAQKQGDGENFEGALNDGDENGLDADFDAEFKLAFNEEENEPGSQENSIQPNGDDASDHHAPYDNAPKDNASAGHTSEDKASEEVYLSTEKSSSPPGSLASSDSKNLSTAPSSPLVLSSSPGTSRTSIVDETSPCPPEVIGPAPRKSTCRVKAGGRKSSAKPPPEYVGLSFRDRRPPTDEHRAMVRKAIHYTHQDLYNRTNIRMDTMDIEKGTSNLYDTAQESFAYQYARAQLRFKQYHESKDLKAGINTSTKKYKRSIDRRFEHEELLLEVEGPWRTGFDDWKPPGTG